MVATNDFARVTALSSKLCVSPAEEAQELGIVRPIKILGNQEILRNLIH